MSVENNEDIDKIDSIGGFAIELNPKDRARIDGLVEHYEQIILKRINEQYKKTASRPDKIADKIASFGGSWRFIIIMGLALLVWIIWNMLPISSGLRFDPAPFILLNLVLSFTAAFQAPIIMMSQNRQAARDKQESVIDFAINYKAEQEIDDMQQHLHRIEDDIKEIKKLLLRQDNIDAAD